MKAALIPALALCLLYACKKEDERDPCLQPSNTVLKARAMRRANDSTTAVVDTALPFPVARPLSNQPVQFIYGGQRRVSQFSLSLSQVSDSCRWSLRPDTAAGSLTDTLTFYYTRQTRFLSNSCGYTTFFNIQRVLTTRHAIDSAVLQNPSITTDVNVENLRIYY